MMKDWRYWRNLLLSGLGVFVLFMVVGLLFLAREQALMYMQPARVVRGEGDNPGSYGVVYEDVVLTAVDGIQLQAWYTPPQNGIVVLVAHGHADARVTGLHTMFAQAGYGVLSWDFRAHGASEGEFTTIGYHEVRDVEAALEYALGQTGVEHIVGWGGSMGGATMVLVAAERPEIEAVVVDSAFASLEEVMNNVIQIDWMQAPIRYFAERQVDDGSGGSIDDVRPIDVIGEISPRPVLLIYGLWDGMFPPDTGERMYAAAAEPKALWVEPEVAHLEMRSKYPEEYEARILAFLEMALADHD
ncbi:MAG TPA: alpha/beta fold hydrolase [Anaerolineae bacterium]|nr:alpha/beta fold hydrolase [Anaerolineae bacterium]